MKYKQMRIIEVGRLYQDGFPDDEELGQIKSRKQGIFKRFRRLKFVFYDRVTTNDEP